MLGCKGLISGHLIMMYCVVLTWPKGFLLLLFAVLRKFFSKVVTMLGFFWKQNTVDSGRTGELPVRSENWAATLWFKFYTTTPNMVSRVSPYPTVAWRAGERSWERRCDTHEVLSLRQTNFRLIWGASEVFRSRLVHFPVHLRVNMKTVFGAPYMSISG